MIHQIATKAGRPARALPMGPLKAFKYVGRTYLTVVLPGPAAERSSSSVALPSPAKKSRGCVAPPKVGQYNLPFPVVVATRCSKKHVDSKLTEYLEPLKNDRNEVHYSLGREDAAGKTSSFQRRLEPRIVVPGSRLSPGRRGQA